LIDLSRLVK